MNNENEFDKLIEKLHQSKPRLNEDLTPFILSSINNNNGQSKRNKIVFFIRTFSSVAAVILLFLYVNLQYIDIQSVENQNITSVFSDLHADKTLTLDEYITHLQRNMQKNEKINVYKNQLNNKQYEIR